MAKRIGGDKCLFFTTLLLVGVGLAMVFSASAVVAEARYHSPYTFVGKQAAWALAVLPHDAQVARPQPAVRLDHLCGALRIAIVALHHRVAASADLALLAEGKHFAGHS